MLTPKMEAFCLAYLKSGNASEAYRKSYSAENMSANVIHNKASALLAKGEVRVRLEQLNRAAVSAAVMSRQEALERLSAFARTDLSDLVEFGSHELGRDDNGQPIMQTAWHIRDSILQDPIKMAAIAELNATKDGIKIKTHSPMQAIQQLAKMQGWDIHELDLEAKRLANDRVRRDLSGAGADGMQKVLTDLIAKLPS